MPRPLFRLRDGSDHWLNNPVPTPQGPTLIRNIDQLRSFVYASAAARRGVTVAETSQRDTDGDPLHVQVNANRWVVVCPDCGGAEFAWAEEPWFMCGSCFNASAGGKWRPVLWPADAVVAEVEAILSARPIPFSRNWDPEVEDPEDLRAQNIANGDPPLVRPEDWEGAEPGPRIKRTRPTNEKSGAKWRQTVKKRPVLRSMPVLPAGWGPPTTIVVPETSDVNDSILYPDVPPPPDSIPPESK